ncbi:tyrosine-type recombinase/integrase, partial [Streptomyces mirabilis]|uniref:tyrosine-type recombinase/integrase n=1 Tax=Streptomyces mirabilis TaxID=68239 RepID=UPI0033DAC2A2
VRARCTMGQDRPRSRPAGPPCGRRHTRPHRPRAAGPRQYAFDSELLVVRHTKFDKSRLVPLHPSTIEALRRYMDFRDRTRPHRVCPALLVSSTGARLLHSNIGLTFTRLAGQAGITRRSASCRPRIHDLRHGFAVSTVLDWYREDADVAAMMPRLSTYLGHTDPKHTYWYLSAAPELMALAGQRLDAHLAGRP